MLRPFRQKETSLTSKLLLIVVSVTLLLLGATYWLIEQGTRHSIEVALERSFDQHAAILQLSLERELREAQLALDSMVLNEELTTSVLDTNAPAAGRKLQQLRTLDRANVLDYLFIRHDDGLVWASAGLMDDKTLAIHRQLAAISFGSEQTWQWYRLNAEQDVPLDLFATARRFLDPDTGRVLGSLIAAVSLSNNALLMNRLRQRSGIDALAVGDGQRLVAMSSTSNQYAGLLGRMNDSSADPQWSAQWHIAERPVVIGATTLPLSWKILTEKNEEAGGILLQSMSLLAVMVVLAMLFIYFVLRQQVVGPLNTLAQDVRWMVEGRARQLASPQGHRGDEIGSLVHSFNDLVSEISSSELRYRQLLDDASVISWETDSDLNFSFISSHVERLLGYSTQECYAPGFWEQHIHPADHETTVTALQQAIRDGQDWEYEYRMLTATGNVVWIRDISNLDIRDGKLHGLRGVLVDITERKQAELSLREQLRFEELVAEMAQQFSESRPGQLDHLLNRSLQRVGEFFAVDRAYLFQFSGDGRTMTNTHEWCAAGVRAHLHDIQAMPMEAMPWWHEQITSSQFVQIRDTHLLPEIAQSERELFEQQGIKSLLAVPLVDGVRVVGFFGFDAVVRQRIWSSREIGLMQVVGASIVAALSRARVEQDLRHETTLLGSLLDSIPDLIFFKDVSGIYLGCNPEFSRFVGKPRQAIVGASDYDLFDAETAELFRLHDQQTMLQAQPRHHEEWVTYPDGSRRLLDTLKAPLRDAQGDVLGLLGVSRDITERKQAEEQIHQLAFYDPLTRLPNRRLLLDRLGQALATSARSSKYGALLFIDLDNFKTLNDTLGHDVGDLLLIEVAKRLQDSTREADTVARLGGDEFVVMLEDMGNDHRRVALEVEAVAEKLVEALNRTYVLNNQYHHSTPSIGITLFQGDNTSVDELLKHADMAMYRAKAAGRNTVRFFEPAMQAHLEQRAAMETDLRLALSQHQFLLYYQPQFDIDERVVGAEALVRWHHPLRGIVSPIEFIPLAEETGLILPLGHWVLETACRHLYRWQQAEHSAALSMAVNISARQFRHPDFVDLVRAVVDHSGINPAGLKLEITESMMLDEVDDTIQKMTELKQIGVSFSIDDFGTGYSSLSYLKRLPLDQLKIDQSFVRDVVQDSNDAVIVQAIIAMADSLGFSTIAEGVETEEQRRFLAEQGCHFYQGYLFSKPLPGEEIDQLLARQAETRADNRA